MKDQSFGFSALLRAGPGIPALAFAILVRSVGSGGLLTLIVLYLVAQRSLDSSDVGVMLSAASFVAAALSVPIGHLSNGSRSRNAVSISLVLQGLAAMAYAAVGGLAGLALVATAYAIAEAASGASRAVLIAGLVAPGKRIMVRSWLRVITNVGSVVGAGLAGIAMAIDTPLAWTVAVVACGVALVFGGLVVLWVPRSNDVPVDPAEREWGVLRDRRFAILSLLNGFLVMNSGVLVVAVPVWLVAEVDAPKSTFGLLVILNTIMVVVLQVPLTRGIVDVRTGVRGLLRAGIALAMACVVFGLAGTIPGESAVGALILGILLHGFAEMMHGAASWQLSYDFAPDHAQGQYQGMFTMSSLLGLGLAPILLASLISAYGQVGWWIIAAVMALAGLLAPPLLAYDDSGSASPRVEVDAV